MGSSDPVIGRNGWSAARLVRALPGPIIGSCITLMTGASWAEPAASPEPAPSSGAPASTQSPAAPPAGPLPLEVDGSEVPAPSASTVDAQPPQTAQVSSEQTPPAAPMPPFEDLDEVLLEAARDLSLDVALQQPASSEAVDEDRLLQAAKDGWTLGAQLLPKDDGFSLRLTVVAPQSKRLVVGRTQVTRDTLEVRAIQLLRDLANAEGRVVLLPERADEANTQIEPKRRSAGRAVLTTHGALVGGYVGFSLEHIGGAGDARLVYPLMTLGAGAGVGASLVIAEEWDISPGEAWYIWASGTWSAASGMIIADAYERPTDSRRYGFGLLGTSIGLTLGSVAVNTGDVTPGGALLTHSGALFGAFFGGLGQMMAEGDTSISPTLGVGVGMGSGLLVAGALSPHVGRLSSSRVLFIDLSAILGGLAGAALASPLLVGEELSKNESRLWLGSVALGTVSGGVVGTFLTTNETEPPMFAQPYVGVVPLSEPSGVPAKSARTVSVVGVQGSW